MSLMPPAKLGLLTSLAAAMQAQGLDVANAELQLLPERGLAHNHVRLVGTGWLARIPKQSQMQLSAQANLEYQSACFLRAGVSGRTPRLHATIPPGFWLERGALLVEEIAGRLPVLPGDLTLIAQALAAIHALPLPAPAKRSPLQCAAEPLRALADEIQGQAAYLSEAKLHPSTSLILETELASLLGWCNAPARPPLRLIAFDAHPGNFIIRGAGSVAQAVLVDLEKCRYSYPGLDLAHASLYTSTTWDSDSRAVLTPAEVASAYLHWEAAVGPAFASAARHWHLPLRRAMWLWSVTWCAKWRVLSGSKRAERPSGEDWSAQLSPDALVAHVRGRVDHYLSEEGVQHVIAEFKALEHQWA